MLLFQTYNRVIIPDILFEIIPAEIRKDGEGRDNIFNHFVDFRACQG